VAVLLTGGLSPGAALAFLLTGPAANISTFGLLGRLHGRKTALVFCSTVIVFSMGLGFLVNAWFPDAGANALNPALEEEPNSLQVVSLVILTGVVLSSLYRRGARKFVAELFFQDQRAIDLHPHYH
jgi:MFS family permease